MGEMRCHNSSLQLTGRRVGKLGWMQGPRTTLLGVALGHHPPWLVLVFFPCHWVCQQGQEERMPGPDETRTKSAFGFPYLDLVRRLCLASVPPPTPFFSSYSAPAAEHVLSFPRSSPIQQLVLLGIRSSHSFLRLPTQAAGSGRWRKDIRFNTIISVLWQHREPFPISLE